MPNLEELSLTELKEIAKENEIKNISKLKKEELIDVLLKQKNKTNNKDSNIDERYRVTNEGDTIVEGILEVLPDGYGFLRGENYLPTTKDVYISPIQIKRFRLNTRRYDKRNIKKSERRRKVSRINICWRSKWRNSRKCIQKKIF